MITRVIREGLEGLVLKDAKAGSHLLFIGVCWELGNNNRQRSVDEAHKAECYSKTSGFLSMLTSNPSCSLYIWALLCSCTAKLDKSQGYWGDSCPPDGLSDWGFLPSFAQGNYEPGKRHWLKVKKDYLNEGAMADTADLVVLGAFYGQGSKGRALGLAEVRSVSSENSSFLPF